MEKTTEQKLKEQQAIFQAKHYQSLAMYLEEMKNQFGTKAIEAFYRVQKKQCISLWSSLAKDRGNSIDDLISLLWEPLKSEGLEYTLERVDNGVQMKCTKCPYVDLAKKLGMTEWFFHLICANDFFIAEGFNPKIGLKRTRTLMEGHDCCDHLYYIKD